MQNLFDVGVTLLSFGMLCVFVGLILTVIGG